MLQSLCRWFFFGRLLLALCLCFFSGACAETEVALGTTDSESSTTTSDATTPDSGTDDEGGTPGETGGSVDGGSEAHNLSPIAALTISHTTGYAPLEVTFDASASTDPDMPDDALTYRFDFNGDGEWDTDYLIDAIVVQTLEEPGQFTPKVEVKDQSGELSEASADESITVVQPALVGDLIVNILADVNRDGLVEEIDELLEDEERALFYPNLDDDDGDGERDGISDEVSGEADLLDMAPILVQPITGLMDSHVVELEVSPPEANDWIRIFRQDEDGVVTLIKGLGESSAVLERAWLESGEGQLYLEGIIGRFEGFDGQVDFVLRLSEGGEVISSDQVGLQGTPIIFSDDTNRGERLFVMDIPQWVGGDHNEALIDAFEEHLPDHIELYKLDGSDYEYDRWVQDSMQTGYFQRPGVEGVDTTWLHFETQRPRPLADFLTETLLGPGSGYVFPRGSNTSLNSGGNIEVVPAHVGPERDYPYGRMVYGGGSVGTLLGASYSDNMNENQVNFFNSQDIQAPAVQVSTEWLAVGHIDEIFLFLPNHQAEEGERTWKVVIASPSLALNALETMSTDGLGEVPIFEGRDAETTVREILEDEDIVNYQALAQARVDSVREVLKGSMGLSDSDFVEVPVLYEYIVEGGGWGSSGVDLALAYNPGIQNLVAADSALFIPDPEGPDRGGVDIWQEMTRAALSPLGFELHFVDVFNSYHVNFGEAHCGTNLERVPSSLPWWEM